MSHYQVDVCVIGSGFAGSLIAMMLASEGRTVALVERSNHPRFAIGESSTPLGNFKLRQIVKRYDLPRLEPLTQYGPWINRYPDLTRGPKRGFSYFWHRRDQAFQTSKSHDCELLVTANRSVESADLHWLRADVDNFLVQEAIREGVLYFDNTSIIDTDAFDHTASIVEKSRTKLIGEREGNQLVIDTRFTVIASGNPKLWEKAIDVPSRAKMPRTNSRSLFAHFANVKKWEDVLIDNGIETHEHPFVCDQSALHHVFDGGWMWQLRFDDETTSAGFMLDGDKYPIDSKESTEQEWQRLLATFPSIESQFKHAQAVRPETGLQRTGRLQNALRQVAGERWALLPAAVGYSDPLFSTGIAHALFATDRLVVALRDLNAPERLAKSIAKYAEGVEQEIDLIDRLVSLAYRSSHSFEHYVAATMPYFAAATSCERAMMASPGDQMPGFLLADDPKFLLAIDQIERSQPSTEKAKSDRCFPDSVRNAIATFNQVGLFSPRHPRMYWHTAAE